MKRRGRNVVRTGALLLVFLAATDAPLFAQPQVEVVPSSSPPVPTVTAIGRAAARIAPDTAVLTFAVEIRDANTTQAVLVNDRMAKKVVAVFERDGLAADDISVDNYQMKHVVNSFVPALGTNQPVEFRLEQHGTYLVTREIVVTLHRVADVGSVISTALNAGVDRIDRVRYEASGLTAVEARLIPQAIADARQKAKALAAGMGLRLGEPLRVEQLPETAASVSVVDGNTLSEHAAPPRIEVHLRVRVVYEAKKGSD